jgi:hypothetical protein
LAHEVPRKGFPDLEEADSQEILGSHAADLTQDLKQLTALGKLGHSDTVVERSELTIPVL